MDERLTGNADAEASNIAGHLALMRAEVREYAARPEYADIRPALLAIVDTFERIINEPAKPPRTKLNGWSAGRGIECLSALGLETSERPGFAKMVVQSQSLELLCCLQKLLAYHLVASSVSQGTTFPQAICSSRSARVATGPSPVAGAE